ncbi:Tetratricopeptide repeat protein 19, mitochondrial [Halocaridina rubra]|uniref:Tetratricopeptide repeat protein 19, mitochondrial n=1 Tax=Halocaridina rubra TaxID=373956 RepID=A0AAN8XD39_HALRR
MYSLQVLKFAMNAQRFLIRSYVAQHCVCMTLLRNTHETMQSSKCHLARFLDQVDCISSPCSLQSPGMPAHSLELRNENSKYFSEKCREQRSSRTCRHSYIPLFALALFQTKKDTEKEEKRQESELIMTIKRSILALQRGELNKAEQLLHISLKIAQESQNTQAETYIFDLMANLAYQREQYTKAEELFKEVLKRMFSDGMAEDDNAVVEISLKLASVYASIGDMEKAVQGFHFCIGTQEEKIKKYGESNLDEDTLLLWAMSMDWYARFLLSLKKYELAKKHFLKAFEMSERVHGPGHPQTAVLLNDIGSVCSLQKNYTDAITYLERAIYVAREAQSPDIASFYVNLGAVYLQQGMLAEAEKHCKEGLKLAKNYKNEEALEEAKSCLEEISSVKSGTK